MSLPGKSSGGGGGYLHGVAGVIVGYNFEAKEWPAKKGDPYTTVSLELQIRQDGADVAVKQFLQAGFLNDDEIVSGDGQRLESEKPVIGVGTEAHRFLESLVEAGFDESELVESNLNDLTPIVNARVTFRREIDEDAKARGQKEKFTNKAGKEVETDKKLLLVKEYHGQVEPVKGKGGKKAVPFTGKPSEKTTSPTKANGKAANADADALIERAEGVLLGILADAGKPVDRTGLSAKIVRYSTENKFSDDAAEHNAIRESLRKLIGSEDFLNRASGWTYDAGTKGQPVSLG